MLKKPAQTSGICQPEKKPTCRRNTRGLRLAVILPIILLITTCGKESTETPRIVLPDTPVLTMDASWAVITSSHLRLREQPDANGAIVTTLWRGFVLEVIAKQNRPSKVENITDFWYQVGFDGLQGWVFGGYLMLYSSREAALAAGESLRQ